MHVIARISSAIARKLVSAWQLMIPARIASTTVACSNAGPIILDVVEKLIASVSYRPPMCEGSTRAAQAEPRTPAPNTPRAGAHRLPRRSRNRAINVLATANDHVLRAAKILHRGRTCLVHRRFGTQKPCTDEAALSYSKPAANGSPQRSHEREVPENSEARCLGSACGAAGARGCRSARGRLVALAARVWLCRRRGRAAARHGVGGGVSDAVSGAWSGVACRGWDRLVRHVGRMCS